VSGELPDSTIGALMANIKRADLTATGNTAILPEMEVLDGV
jgi:hypothetical protein